MPTYTRKTRISKLWWNASRNTPGPQTRWHSRAKKKHCLLRLWSEIYHLTAPFPQPKLEVFMQVVPNSGKASWQIATSIYSCLNRSADLTLEWKSSHHLFHCGKAVRVCTCLCQHVHAGARTEGGQQPCWLPQIFLQLWFDWCALR